MIAEIIAGPGLVMCWGVNSPGNFMYLVPYVLHHLLGRVQPSRRQPQRARRYTKEVRLPPADQLQEKMKSASNAICPRFSTSARGLCFAAMFLIFRIQSSQSHAWCGFRSSDYPLFAPRLVHMPVDGLHSIAGKEDRVFDFWL